MENETETVIAVSLKLNIPYSQAKPLVNAWRKDYPEYAQQSLLEWTLAGDIIYVNGKLSVKPYTTPQELTLLIAQMRGPNGLEIKHRWYHMIRYANCFVGREAVKWLTHSQGMTREVAIRTGQRLIERNIIHHVVDDIGFEDKYLFYRFSVDENR